MTFRIIRLGALASTRVSNVDKHSVDGQVPVRLCNYTDVYYGETLTNDLEFMRATATQSQVRAFRLAAGDTLITKDSETADDIGIPAYVANAGHDLVCGYHLAVIRPDQTKIHPRYLFWSMSSDEVAAQWEVLATGVTRVGLKSTELKTVRVQLPETLDDQRAIADYLDRETAEIDLLIEKQTALIDRLRERKIETIRHLVTRSGTGASPSPAQTWTGDLPEGWSSTKVAWLFGRTSSGTTPSPEEILDSASGLIPWVNTAELREATIWTTRRAVAPETVARLSALRVFPSGTILLAMYGATIGRLGVLGVPAATNQACCALADTRSDRVEADFVFYALWAAREYFVLLASGGGQPNINQDKIRSLRLPLPPLQEQRRIVDHLNRETAKIDELIAKTERFIELTKERRSALITAAVTGQVDVTGRGAA